MTQTREEMINHIINRLVEMGLIIIINDDRKATENAGD